jgi:ankyrin repeat protein
MWLAAKVLRNLRVRLPGFLRGLTLLASATALASCNDTPDLRLIGAAREGDMVSLRAAISAHANPSYRDDSGDTALMGAAATCHPDAVRALIAAGAEVDGRSSDSNPLGDKSTALMGAAGSDQDGCPEAVKALLAAGAGVNAQTTGGETALDAAALEGNLATAQLLIAAGADVNHPGPGGMTPLGFASGPPPGVASAQRRAAVALLLQQHGGHG